jgi:hypothetical protein
MCGSSIFVIGIEGNKHIGLEGLGTKKCELKKVENDPRWREHTL